MKRKQMSQLEMAAKIRSGINFHIGNERERKMALTAAKYLGAQIHTRKVETGFFVYFLSAFQS